MPSNSVFGPARKPIFNPPPKRGSSRVSSRQAADVKEAVWSFGGDITVNVLLDAGLSPNWSQYGPARIELLAAGFRLAARVSTTSITVALVSSDATVVEATLDDDTDYGSDGWYRVLIGIVTDVSDFWVVADDAMTPSDDVVGHGLTIILWYRATTAPLTP